MKQYITYVLLLLSVFVAVVYTSTVLKQGVPCADKRIILDYHNDLRRMVANGTVLGQPKASNMENMVWDDALATIAQNWANKMKYAHNPGPKDSRFRVGENLYISYSTSKDDKFEWIKAIKAWFNEEKIYKYKKLVHDPATGHYTQIVWADTIYLGCGAIHYTGHNGMRNKYYVCNYGPAGNWIGEFPYKTGKGCEKQCTTKGQNKLLAYGNACPTTK